MKYLPELDRSDGWSQDGRPVWRVVIQGKWGRWGPWCFSRRDAIWRWLLFSLGL